MNKAQSPKNEKGTLTQRDLKAGVKTFEEQKKPRAALETREDKNNGA
ncbi:hypothetical protein [Mucilaginibacter gossypii]|uniref:Uncharacterized protein n=1 Tax=Mucilaginibacter gossypii TaxID=551996 RepID=A0A1G7ZY26_9SPHI|nr:hypothetical protein [Mucilaginibacter gossypii]SDH13562.1 hypothetical protein SAMN05192573_10734 [Mucilaginibacter gossypii]